MQNIFPNLENIPSSIGEICSLFGCELLTEQVVDPETNRESSLFYIGKNPTQQVQGFELTPGFDYMPDLENYCVSVDGKAEINTKAEKIFPDWDVIDCCFAY